MYAVQTELLYIAGDWNISILNDDENIEGSPFNVRVYDPGQIKVYGIEGGRVRQNFNFFGKMTEFISVTPEVNVLV